MNKVLLLYVYVLYIELKQRERARTSSRTLQNNVLAGADPGFSEGGFGLKPPTLSNCFFLFCFFFYYRTITIFLNKFQYEKKSVLMRKLKRNHKAYASWASSKYNNNLKFIQTA